MRTNFSPSAASVPASRLRPALHAAALRQPQPAPKPLQPPGSPLPEPLPEPPPSPQLPPPPRPQPSWPPRPPSLGPRPALPRAWPRPPPPPRLCERHLGRICSRLGLHLGGSLGLRCGLHLGTRSLGHRPSAVGLGLGRGRGGCLLGSRLRRRLLLLGSLSISASTRLLASAPPFFSHRSSTSPAARHVFARAHEHALALATLRSCGRVLIMQPSPRRARWQSLFFSVFLCLPYSPLFMHGMRASSR